MKLQISNIPSDLKETDRWVCWEEQMRDGKATKIPKSPVEGVEFASTDDSDTWSNFSDAIKTFRTEEYDGIGFVFTTEGNYVGVDLDDCRDPETGEFEEWAIDVMETLDSFSEISPSGTGSHVIVKGGMPEGRKRRGDIEMYEDGRYFTVTGEVVSKQGRLVDEARSIVERSDELREVASQYLYDDEESPSENHSASDAKVDIDEIDIDGTQTEHTGSGDLKGIPEEDQERLKKMFRRKQKVYNLWNGSTAGYPSQSEADQALCNHLAYWLDKSARRIDRAFRNSRLYRDKWDEVHYSDGSTYGEGTIKEAINATDATYSSDHEQNGESDDTATEEESKDELKAEQPSESRKSTGGSDDEQESGRRSRDRGSRSDRQRSRNRKRDRGNTANQPQSEDRTQGNSPSDGDQSSEGSAVQPTDDSTNFENGRRRGRNQVESLTYDLDSSSDTSMTGDAETSEPNSSQSNGSVAQSSDLNIPDLDDLDGFGTSSTPASGNDQTQRDQDRAGRENQNTQAETEDTESTSFFDSFDQEENKHRSDPTGDDRQTQPKQNRGELGSQTIRLDETQRQSANGQRAIPTASEERVRELGLKLDELEEKIGQVRVEVQNEHDMTQQSVRETINELRHYEDVVDKLDGQVKVLSILVQSLCNQIETPAADEIAAVAQNVPNDPAQLPTSVLNQEFSESVENMQTDESGRESGQRGERKESRSDGSEEDEGGFIDSLMSIGRQER